MGKSEKKRQACPHCDRKIVVIGKKGQLARHHCQDAPATMTPTERLANARNTEQRARKRREHNIRLLQRAQRRLPFNYVAAAMLAVCALVMIAGALTADVSVWTW